MAGQKEKGVKQKTTKRDPYSEQVRSTKKDAGPTVEEAGYNIWKGLADLGSMLWTGKPMSSGTTMVKGAIRKKKTY